MEMLKARVTKNLPLDAIHLFGTNAEVNDFNGARLEEEPGVEYTIIAINIHPTQQNYKPKLGRDRNINNTPFQNVLKLKLGAKIMVTYNINIKDRLVNGAMRTVR